MTIDELLAALGVDGDDLLAIYDKNAPSGTEPTQKITITNFVSSILTLGEILTQSSIVNNLTSTETDKPLSAAQGKALNDNLKKLNSNLGELNMWIGTIPFAFNNTDSASVVLSQYDGGISESRIVGCSCIPVGYAQATFGFDSNKYTLIMKAHQVYSVTLNAIVIVYYS